MRFSFLFIVMLLPLLSACQTTSNQVASESENAELAMNKGMTWAAQSPHHKNIWAECYARSKVVGAELPSCNPYQGDTQCSMKRPLLCINKKGLPQPKETVSSQQKYNRQWSGAEIRVTEPVKGTKLTSKEAADSICAGEFGAGWQMAEFHDGGQWGFWAKGTINPSSRFWVSINDQAANCWDKRP